ncbi:hypothetical protein QUF70_13470, partial [Desulfobacterales bacterium HSG17]|nr:hypothetical protein [Desulfobacterales bacterium HSG17]
RPEQGYWARAKAENVWLRFPGTVIAKKTINSVDSERITPRAFSKTKTWLKKNIFSLKTANADSGQGPPLPISGINSSEGSASCFIKSAVCD